MSSFMCFTFNKVLLYIFIFNTPITVLGRSSTLLFSFSLNRTRKKGGKRTLVINTVKIQIVYLKGVRHEHEHFLLVSEQQSQPEVPNALVHVVGGRDELDALHLTEVRRVPFP